MSFDPFEDADADPFAALAALGEHLTRARAVLPPLPAQSDPAPDADTEPAGKNGPGLARVLDVAQAAVASLADFAGGLQRTYAGGGIGLRREGSRVTVGVLGAPTPADIAAFAAELAALDRRFLDAAELLGLLLHLAAGWAAAGFAPPVVLESLRDGGPRVLSLGAGLLRAPATPPPPA